jgi:hypothetical protein
VSCGLRFAACCGCRFVQTMMEWLESNGLDRKKMVALQENASAHAIYKVLLLLLLQLQETNIKAVLNLGPRPCPGQI